MSRLAGFFLFLFLCNCTPKLSPVDAPITDPEAFSISGTQALPEKWWNTFNDPVLDSLVETGLKENLSLAGNWEEYRAALATVQREKSFLFPRVDAFAGVATEQPGTTFSENSDLQAGLSAAYEVDLWGRIRAGIQAERYTAEAIYAWIIRPLP